MTDLREIAEDDEYPPYPRNVRRMAQEAHEDGRRQSEVLVIVVAGIVAGCAAAGLLVLYGVF